MSCYKRILLLTVTHCRVIRYLTDRTSCWHLLGLPATCLMWGMSPSSSGVVTGLKASSMSPGGLRWWTSVSFLLWLLPAPRTLVLGDCLWGSIGTASNLFSSSSSQGETREKHGRFQGLKVTVWVSQPWLVCLFVPFIFSEDFKLRGHFVNFIYCKSHMATSLVTVQLLYT